MSPAALVAWRTSAIHFGGADLAGYAITGDRLATLATPTTILTAMDDPIIGHEDLDRRSFADPLCVRLTADGGHCGCLTSLAGASWADQVLVAEFGRE